MVATTGGGIQKRIHQIWIGKNPQPHLWMNTVKEFAEAHGYDYKLWTDASIKELDFDAVPGMRAVYDHFVKTEKAGQADIIRMVALYTYGGIYIDADSVMMKSDDFAKFLEKNRAGMFFGWEDIPKKKLKKLGDLGPTLKGATRLIANGVIGCRKGHPFMKELMKQLKENAEAEKGEAAWRQVGPLFVTRVWKEVRGRFPDVHIYPMKYFYPLHWHGLKDPYMHEKVKIPKQSMMFQYGYSTNSFADIFKRMNARNATRRLQKGGGTRKQRLFNDNPRGRPRLAGLGYGTEERAQTSIKALRKMPRAYQQQAATTMYYRAKYHARQTAGMRAAMRVYGRFLKTLKRK